MTIEEIKRLDVYKTLATFNRVQVEDYFSLLAKELIEKAEAEAAERKAAVVEEKPKRKRTKKTVN